MEETAVLHTKHLKKYFGSVHAVEDVSLRVQRGEIFGFLGPNGAGKTTSIGMILGLLHPTGGEVSILGERVTPGQTRVLRQVGTMVGTPALLPPFSARRNLQLLARLYPELPTTRIDEVLEQVGLHQTSQRAVRTFSTGMKQRLGLGLALLNRPDLLILDEPTNGMDPAGMQEVRTLLRSLAEQGTTVFLSSHLLHEMELLCDQIAVIQHGRIITQGKVDELLKGSNIVRIRSTHSDATALALRELPGAHSIHQQNASIDVQGISSEQIIEFLVARNLTPGEVTTSRPDLESVFLELTQNTESSQNKKVAI